MEENAMYKESVSQLDIKVCTFEMVIAIAIIKWEIQIVLNKLFQT